MIKDWITLDTLHIIKEKMGNSLESIFTRDSFMNRKPMAQTLRPTMDKWDLMKLQSFYKAKGTVNWTNWQPIDLHHSYI